MFICLTYCYVVLCTLSLANVGLLKQALVFTLVLLMQAGIFSLMQITVILLELDRVTKKLGLPFWLILFSWLLIYFFIRWFLTLYLLEIIWWHSHPRPIYYLVWCSHEVKLPSTYANVTIDYRFACLVSATSKVILGTFYLKCTLMLD